MFNRKVVGLLLAFVATPAYALPDCWGLFDTNASGEKVARVSCKDDKDPASAQEYSCTWTWKLRSKDGNVHDWGSTFVWTRNQPETLIAEETRLNGSPIDDEVDGFHNSCSAQ